MQDCTTTKEATSCRPTVENVVERVGLGYAQTKVLFTAGIFHFNRGIQTGLLTILTIPMANSFGLSPVQSGFLSTVMFLGMFAGTMVSGWLGDTLGRRFPIIAGSSLMVAVTLWTLISTSYISLVFARMILGICIAFGDIPTNMIISEVTPPRWRIPLRAGAESFFDIGFTYAAFCATIADPKLRAINWQTLLLYTAIPPGVLALGLHYFMPESPIFLASVGRREEAEQVFASFAKLNGKPNVDVKYESPPIEQAKGKSSWRKVALIFSKKYIMMTFVVAYTAFMVNIFYYGGMYSQPQVMTKGHGLEPGWEIVIGGPADILGLVVVTLIGTWLPRRTVLAFSLSMAAIGMAAFGYGGSVPERSILVEIIYQWGVFGFYWIQAMAFVVIGQVAVETFPTVIATTGASVSLSMGRVGALAAPMIFENVRLATGQWAIFCYGASLGCVLAVVLMLMFYVQVKPGEEERSPEASSPFEMEDDQKLHKM